MTLHTSAPGIRLCDARDFAAIHAVINDGAGAYRGHVPPDRLADPYMSAEKLRDEIAAGVQFWAAEEKDEIVAVMGIQPVRDVT